MKRVTTYWFLCLAGIVLASWIWNAFLDPELTLQAWTRRQLLPLVVPLVGSLVLLPLAWADMIRLSNRIVAPVHSIRTAMRRLLLGDDVPAIDCRSDDYWQDFTKQFNRLALSQAFESSRKESSITAVSISDDRNNEELEPVE